MIQKVINFSIIGNNKQQNEFKNFMNVPQSYPVNKEIINLEKFNREACNATENNHKTKFKFFCKTKNIMKKHIFDLQTNNEIKVLKYNKVVYINKNLLNKYSTARGIKKFKKINFIIRKNRSSKYRGVSKNGSKWQVLIMINSKKCYLGNYLYEDLAARIYDIQAIKTWGIKARTNFVYDNSQIKKIYNKNINIKCDNISDIMEQLNN